MTQDGVVGPPAVAASGRKPAVIKIPLSTNIRIQMTRKFSKLTIYHTTNLRTVVGSLNYMIDAFLGFSKCLQYNNNNMYDNIPQTLWMKGLNEAKQMYIFMNLREEQI